MGKTYNICGTSYTVDDLIAIMREEIPTLRNVWQRQGNTETCMVDSAYKL